MSKIVALLCIHHMFSLSLFPRGWRKFVFQLFDDIRWDESNWADFDAVGELIFKLIFSVQRRECHVEEV